MLTVLGLLLICGLAQARDLGASLAEAEGEVASAEAELAAKEERVDEARVQLRAASKHASGPVEGLKDSRVEVRRLRRSLADEERAADARISALEKQHQQEVENHDEEVRSGVGFGLAALVAALIAFGWGWFRRAGRSRRSPPWNVARRLGSA